MKLLDVYPKMLRHLDPRLWSAAIDELANDEEDNLGISGADGAG
jgi:hypothetical protein